MATTKPKVKPEDDDEGETDETEPDAAHEAAKGMLREVVDEALAEWTKKNKPAPRRTNPDNEGAATFWESLFGK